MKFKLQKNASLLFVAALIAGCTSQRDYDFVVTHAIASLGGGTNVETVVLAPALPDQARSAAAKHYKIMDQATLVPVAGYNLAPGLVVLKSVTISGNVAHVIGTTGPIQSNANLDCGGTHNISYSKIDGQWRMGIVQTTVC